MFKFKIFKKKEEKKETTNIPDGWKYVETNLTIFPVWDYDEEFNEKGGD